MMAGGFIAVTTSVARCDGGGVGATATAKGGGSAAETGVDAAAGEAEIWKGAGAATGGGIAGGGTVVAGRGISG